MWFAAQLRKGTALTAVLGLTLAATVAVTFAVVNPTKAGATTPGTPGTAQAGTPIYSEDFSNQSASAAPISILNYTGSAGTSGADSETYTADPQWTPAGKQCDGWILNSTSPIPSAALDSGCKSATTVPSGNSWLSLQNSALALGTAQGQSPAVAAQNQVLSEYTDGAVDPGAGFELKTAANTIPAVAGHYYAVSAWFGEQNCSLPGPTFVQASETFSLVENGTVVPLSTGLDPCTATGAIAIGNTTTVKLQSAALKMPAGVNTLGLQLFNAQPGHNGNDVAFDLPQIVDVTPQLDKAFSPTTIVQGATSTLTYTVTNTNDLQAKNGWSFTDNLPTNVTATGVNSTTCSSGTVTAAAGSTSVVVAGGNLNLAQTSCTISVQVTASVVGAYTNSGCVANNGTAIAGCTTNFPAIDGLNNAGSTTLTVTPPTVSASCATPTVFIAQGNNPQTFTQLYAQAQGAAGATFSTIGPAGPLLYNAISINPLTTSCTRLTRPTTISRGSTRVPVKERTSVLCPASPGGRTPEASTRPATTGYLNRLEPARFTASM